MLELTVREEDEILKFGAVDEKHYQLIPRSQISDNELHVLKESEV